MGVCGASPSAPPSVPRGYLLINALFIVCSPPHQRNFSQSVNSVAVLRLMGRAGGGSAAGGGRGRVGTRSRGGCPISHP